MRAVLLGAFVLSMVSTTFAWSGHCAKYETSKFPEYLQAISVVAKKTQYTEDELCNLPRILDIEVNERVLFPAPTYEPELNVTVTLHYGEYSCQYFVRKADMRPTTQNCYSTF